FDLVTLEAVAALPESALIAVLDEAAASRLIGDVPGTSGRLRFAHMLIRDAVYEDLTRATRMRLHRDVGEALERIYAGNRAPHLAELAHHFVAAGGATVDKAIDYSVLAAEHAAVQHAYEEAARLYAIAIERLDRSAGADRRPRGATIPRARSGGASRRRRSSSLVAATTPSRLPMRSRATGRPPTARTRAMRSASPRS